MNRTSPARRVLIVDDSRTIRAMLRALVNSEDRLHVVGEAGDPYEARQKIKDLNPDVLTLDVEMPRMNGLVFLEHLMRLRPMPVVMVSTRTTENSETAVRALSLGAVDCIDLKTFHGDPQGPARLAETLLMAADASVANRAAGDRATAAPPPGFRWNGKMVLIGSSTGGVDALERVLSPFPADCPPTLIAQHMPAAFLRSFADRLNGLIAPRVQVLDTPGTPEPGHVYLAAGGAVHASLFGRRAMTIGPLPDDGTQLYVPSVELLFRSALPWAEATVAVMLTGMGRDGADAMKALRDHGGHTIVQSGRSCVIDGMPRAARDAGAAVEVHDLDDIGQVVLKAASRHRASVA